MRTPVIELPLPPANAFARLGFIDPDHVDVFAISSSRRIAVNDVVLAFASTAPSWMGALHVLAAGEHEVVLGSDGRLFDVRVSIVVVDRSIIVLTTLLRFHGRVGRSWFAMLRPFHRRAVPSFLRGLTVSPRRAPDPVRIS
jgi:hypothetical protein